MSSAKENSRAPDTASKARTLIAESYGRLKLRSSTERLFPSSSTSPQSVSTRTPSRSPVRSSVPSTLPKSLLQSFSTLTLRQETVGRVQVDHTAALKGLFERRSPTVPKAPLLQTERRALARSSSPEKMAGDPNRRQGSTSDRGKSSGGPGSQRSSNSNSTSRPRARLTPERPVVNPQDVQDMMASLGTRLPSRPQAGNRNGIRAPKSSPVESEQSNEDAEERKKNPKLKKDGSCQDPTTPQKRHKDSDDDDHMPPKATGPPEPKRRYDSVVAVSKEGRPKSVATGSGSAQNGTNVAAVTFAPASIPTGPSFTSNLNGSAPWFIPFKGRYEQLLPREQLMYSSNWHKEEGKIPCGFSERAKFTHGGYRAGSGVGHTGY